MGLDDRVTGCSVMDIDYHEHHRRYCLTCLISAGSPLASARSRSFLAALCLPCGIVNTCIPTSRHTDLVNIATITEVADRVDVERILALADSADVENRVSQNLIIEDH